MIVIDTDAAQRRLVVTMSGWLTVADVEQFDRERQATLAAMGIASGTYDLLVVAIGNIVQSQEVMNAFARILTTSSWKARKFATVRDGVLTRMQSRRMSDLRSNAEVFDNRADAEAWLLLPIANDTGEPMDGP